MTAVNDVPQLVDKKGGSYAAIAPKLEPRKFNKWKKRMLCYLAGMEPYYLKCIKDGPFQPKTADGDAKPEAKSTESLSQTYTRYKTVLNELSNDGVNLSKHEINVGFVNSLPEKWLTFSQGLRNANHTQTLDLANIYGRTSEEYLRDLDIEYHERALLANSKRFIKRRNNFLVNNYSSVSKGFQPKFTPKLIQSSSNSNNQADLKFQKDYKAEYKKIKAKLALLESSTSSSQNPKTFQPKNKGLVAKTFDWDKEEDYDEEEVTQVNVLMALADDELIVGKSHARNGEWVDITIRKVNTLLSMDEDADWKNYLKYINIDLKFVEEQRLNLLSKYNKMVFELNRCRDELLIIKQANLDVEKKINEKWLTSSKKVSQCISEQIPHQKKKVLGGELLIESSYKMNENENLFVPASIGYDQEMVPKTKEWVERLNPDSKLLNFNTGRILVPESQAINKSLETLNTPESSKDSEVEFLTPLPLLESLQGASPSSKVMPLTFQPHSPKERPGLDEKVNSDQKTQESNSKIQKAESSKSVDSSKISQDSKPKVQSTGSSKSLRPKPIQKPQLKCELCHYTNHSTDNCYRILYCMICKREDHRTSDHEMYIASLKRSENYKAQPYQYASSSNQILRAKAKPFPPCTLWFY
ncbi:hypothetical protein Tco_1126193 [Tanacetum coccineum]